MQGKQLPIPDEDSQIFWAGCQRQRLLIQQCDACQTFRFPPSPLCPSCLSAFATWRSDPGKGEVLTFCVYHAALASPVWEADLPYTVAVVQLQYSGIKMLSNLRCENPAAVRVGLPVQVVFASLTDEITLPQFVPCLEGLPLRYDAEEICTTEA